MITYIYSLSDPETGLVRYVGKTVNLKARFNNHCSSITSDHKGNWINSLKNKGLKPIIEILEEANKDDYAVWETYWIQQMRCWGFNLVNLSQPENLGNSCHSETRQKISLANRGKKRTPEQRKAQSERLKKSGKRPAIINKTAYLKRTEETYDKISQTLSGRKWDIERKSNFREIKYSKSRLNKKEVVEIYNLAKNKKVFQKDIAKMYNINQSDVSNIINKRRFIDWTENL